MLSLKQEMYVDAARDNNLFEDAGAPLPVTSVYVGAVPRVVSAGGFVDLGACGGGDAQVSDTCRGGYRCS